MNVAKTGPKGLIIYDRAKAYNGYNFFFPRGTNDCFLMDMEGRFVHQWRVPYPSGCHGILLPNGNILYAGTVKTREELGYGWTAEFGGLGGVLLEIDWDSNIVWKAEVPCQGHDFTVMENGHIMYIAWEPKGIVPDEIAAKVKGGLPGTQLNGKIWGDVLVEIDRDGNRVWEWLAYEHLDPEIDAICPLEHRSQWPYVNSVQICRDGNVLLSTRHLNQVTKIGYKTGKVIGRYGRGKIYHQHDARELNNGNILLFDNGTHRHEYEPEYSRVVELDPKTDEIVWEYKANPPSDFFSSHSSGCERQPNGNTVINETFYGRIFEVTPNCEIVWEYVFPRYIPFLNRFSNELWRAHRYPCDYPGLKGKDSDPETLVWLNRIWGPGTLGKDIRPCIF
jgi:hypothetical protein